MVSNVYENENNRQKAEFNESITIKHLLAENFWKKNETINEAKLRPR